MQGKFPRLQYEIQLEPIWDIGATKCLQSIDYNCLMMVEAGESEYPWLLKTRNLLKNRHAQNALASEIAPNWNVSGTRVFRCSTRIFDSSFLIADAAERTVRSAYF